jgi:hypothetical protein
MSDRRPLAGFQVFVTVPVRPQEAKRGAVFAIMVQLSAEVRNRGTNIIGEVICHGDKLGRSRLVQCRGTKMVGLEDMSRCKIF